MVLVGPLDGFVMNRVLGDYFETLLYKIFVTINDETAVTEVDSPFIQNHLQIFSQKTTALQLGKVWNNEIWASLNSLDFVYISPNLSFYVL